MKRAWQQNEHFMVPLQCESLQLLLTMQVNDAAYARPARQECDRVLRLS